MNLRNYRSSFGHAHFWQRAALSRRNFLGTAGGALASGLALPPIARAAADALPKPIPGGTDLFSAIGLPPGPIFHLFLPGLSPEMSTITDNQRHCPCH